MSIKIATSLSICILLVTSCTESNDQLFDRAVALGKVKKYEEVIRIYSEIIKRNNKLQLAYFNRGLCYFNLQVYPKALLDFDKVISLQTIGAFRITFNKESPFADEETLAQVDYNQALYQRAQVKYYLNSIKSSFQDFQTLISNNYEKSNCLLWLGTLWIRSGKKETGCEYFERAKAEATTSSDRKEAERMLSIHCKTK